MYVLLQTARVQQVERTVKRELGGTISELFAEFDEHAVAAASLAQVYLLTTVTDRQLLTAVTTVSVTEVNITERFHCVYVCCKLVIAGA
jgi:ABC1 atypical kinase-like domain